MARKSDAEKLREIEEQMERMKAKKQQVQSRINEKERKARTKRLIEVGAIMEKYFDIQGQEEAEKIAIALKGYVAQKKDTFLSMSHDELEALNDKYRNGVKE